MISYYKIIGLMLRANPIAYGTGATIQENWIRYCLISRSKWEALKI